jgi:hypothetical protein
MVKKPIWSVMETSDSSKCDPETLCFQAGDMLNHELPSLSPVSIEITIIYYSGDMYNWSSLDPHRKRNVHVAPLWNGVGIVEV